MISVVVLTHDDEKILERCLKSLSWCDEVVVIDDNSTDGTVAVGKKLGATVFSHSLNDDFAAQRNIGLERTKGEWVLFVDSDEVVTPELALEMQDTIPCYDSGLGAGIQSGSRVKPGMTDTVGYVLKRRDFFLGRWLEHGESTDVRLLRLARKNAGKWVQPVHEEWKIEGAVGELSHPLLHYPHPNVAQFLEEINRYSTLYARYLHSLGVKEPVWQIVGKPILKFFVNYVWRLGFVDGSAGMVMALMMSFHSFLVRSKLRRL